jgi:hypothetical protein
MVYPEFPRERLELLPLVERTHDMTLADVLPLDWRPPPYDNPGLMVLAERIAAARRAGRPVVMLMGAHVIKRGLSRFVIDLMERGILTHVGGNGACAIHDYELALIGATTESVAKYLPEGKFGLWRETGGINDAVNAGVKEEMGFGAAVGRAIEEGKFPHREVSILAAGYRLGVSVTIHIGIGQDIIHMYPNFDPCAAAAASYRDFLALARTFLDLDGGVFLNYGTAVMGPEVFQKALSMARNLAHQEGRRIDRIATAVFDLQELGPDVHREAPRDDPRYYFRPYKTVLVRAVRDGGESFYIRGDHRVTLPHLWRLVLERL